MSGNFIPIIELAYMLYKYGCNSEIHVKLQEVLSPYVIGEQLLLHVRQHKDFHWGIFLDVDQKLYPGLYGIIKDFE